MLRLSLLFSGATVDCRAQWNPGSWCYWCSWQLEKETPKPVSRSLWTPTTSNSGAVTSWKRSTWKCPGTLLQFDGSQANRTIAHLVKPYYVLFLIVHFLLQFLQVAKIETEKMLIQMVEAELESKRKEGSYTKQFKGQSHFFG